MYQRVMVALSDCRVRGIHPLTYRTTELAGENRGRDRKSQRLRNSGKRFPNTLPAKILIASVFGSMIQANNERLRRLEDIPPQALGNTALCGESQRLFSVENTLRGDRPVNALRRRAPRQQPRPHGEADLIRPSIDVFQRHTRHILSLAPIMAESAANCNPRGALTAGGGCAA